MSRKDPLVSIITPTYRHEAFIEACLRSVQAQAHRNWELIAVDDASPDRTAELIEGAARKDSRIRLIRHERNYGAGDLPASYNEALAAASGDLVAVLEGDDEWSPDKLVRQVPVFDDPGVVLSYGDFDQITDGGRLILRHGVQDAAAVDRSGLHENLRFFATLKSFGANTVMVRRSALERAGGFVTSGLPLVDFPTWLRVALEGDFVRIPAVLGTWRRHLGSVYLAREFDTLRQTRDYFLEFLATHQDLLATHGIDAAASAELARTADGAFELRRRSQAYIQGKYRLFLGRRLSALPAFGRALISPATPARYRLGALVGLAASLTSPRLISALGAIGRPGGAAER